jgi:outer membrane protein insertion porin family/translocation and assembly module TamA
VRSLIHFEGALALAAAWSLGCASIPRGAAAVDAVRVRGNHAVPSSDIEEKMATTPSPKFLGLFQGLVYDYELFDRSVLERDLERVQRYYRARGFYETKVRAGRVRYTGDSHVSITVEVEEDKPVLVDDVQIDGIAGLPAKDAAAVRSALGESLSKGRRFEEDPFRKAENAMKRALTDRGYAWAKVERRADVDLPARSAQLFFAARPGPKAVFGAIRIEGLGELPEAPVRRALDISPSAPYSTATRDTAVQAVLDLGTFSSVEITPVLAEPPPPDRSVPLEVRVQPQKLRSILLGGGIEIDSIRTEAHLHLGWEHKNLFGGFRHFTVDLKPGVDLYPTRLPTLQKPTAALLEERLRAELRQPGFIEARTHGVISSELNTYPVLLTPTVDPKAPVIGYLEYKGSLALDRTIWKLFVAPSYDFQFNKPFTYEGRLDRDLYGIAISYVDVLAHFDLRDDSIHPHQGVYLENDLQVAGLGGDARDVRIKPEVRGYLPVAKKVTLAARATVGFLFPFNYGSNLKELNDPLATAAEAAAASRDVQTIYLRGFFSGGPSSNRGYPLQGVGPHGPVPFFDPQLQAHAVAQSCDPTSMSYDPVRCAVPLGGLSLWEASVELRFPLLAALSGATFCDAGDVSPDRLSIRLEYPHLSCGLGLRYDTPIGPVRIDAGYRIPGAQFPKGVAPLTVGDPGTLYGVPVAVSFGIGEAF